ncbi:MAG: GIY-YIG nuclease family protein [Halobacteriovoraceae bacterium]|jgi:DNA polymerase III subunit epsilon|nr:GIY-YIG nuclease family protein [Halobacteriovoraceae bacterium]
MKFSLIDIETTGGSPRGNKITEVAIINHDGEKIEETYSTLINPECSIPYFITRMTGISNKLVEDAPRFYQVAKKIVEMTEGRIFVAHNVRFDYEFIKKEFEELGFVYQRPLLCTVRLGRKIIPGHKSYSLGKICADLGIDIQNRHRAMGDCEAMTTLFEHYLLVSPSMLESSVVDTELKEAILPPQLKMEQINALPEAAGVYYFYNESGEVLYVGKSCNIRSRVKTHLRADTKSSKNTFLRNSIADVSFTLTGTETLALLLENSEIKAHRPQMNRALKKDKFLYGLFLMERPFGLQLKLKGVEAGAWMEFLTIKKGQRFLEQISKNFGIPFHPDDRFMELLPYQWQTLEKGFHYPSPDCVLTGAGREAGEESFLWLEEGVLKGYGFFRPEEINCFDDMRDQLSPLAENPEIKKILLENFSKFKLSEIPCEQSHDFD